MLQLFVNNNKMDLTEDVSINLTLENPLLLQERIPVPYSYSFELPGTQKNLKEFNNPHRLNSSGNWKEQDMRLAFGPISLLEGKILMTEHQKKIKVNLVGTKLPWLIKENINYIQSDSYDFGVLDSSVSYYNQQCIKNYQNLIWEKVKSGDEWTVCPVRYEKKEYPGRPGVYDIVAYTSMYFNNFNPTDGSYKTYFGEQTKVYYHSPVFPQIFIHKLFDDFFEGSLAESPFRDLDWLRDLVMITSYHPNFRIDTQSVILDQKYPNSGDEISMTLDQYYPEYPFNDFLKNILKIFCMSLVKKPDGDFSIVQNSNIINSGSKALDWNSKLTGTPTRSEMAAQTYACGYNDAKSEDEGKYDTTPESVNDTYSIIHDKEPESAKLYRIQSTGEVYEKELVTLTGQHDNDYQYWKYTRKYDGLGSEYEEGEYNMKSDVRALPMTIHNYQVPNSDWKPWYVPSFDADRFDNTLTPSISFFRGWINLSTGKIAENPSSYVNHYPFLSPFAVDWKGTDIGYAALDWSSDMNLHRSFHGAFSNWINKDKQKLSAYFRLTALDLKNIDWTKKIYLQGKNYLLNKVEVTVKKRSISLAKCELIEL